MSRTPKFVAEADRIIAFSNADGHEYKKVTPADLLALADEIDALPLKARAAKLPAIVRIFAEMLK